MINKDSHDSKPALSKFTLRSVRPALAVSAVALSVFGLSQVSGTSAAWQDAGNTATSGGLTVAANVLPAVTISNNTTTGGTITYCRLTWTHLNAAFKYRIYVKETTGGFKKDWYYDPTADGVAAGTSISDDINNNDTTFAAWPGGDKWFNIEIHTVNRVTNDEGADWRGFTVKRYESGQSVACGVAASNVGGVSGASQGGEFNARLAAPVETTTSPSTTLSSTVSATTTTSPAATPSTTTTTSSPVATPSTTTATSPTTTESAPATTTSTATIDTPLSAVAKSTSNDYSATLVRSTETSQTAIVISDANGEELKRISATASTQYKWDSSTDTLWIVDGGQLYKASGSSWTKTSVDPSSSDVPADLAALVE